jgi:FkbM family methyltransferase
MRIKRVIDGVKRRLWALHPRSFEYERKGKEHSGKPIDVTFDSDIKARVWPNDVLGKSLFVQGKMEPGETKYIKSILRPGMVFVDVGANMGYYSLLAAKMVGSTGKVHSFEPNQRMFGELGHNIALNGFDNVRINNFALGERDGIAKISRYEKGKEVYGSLSDRAFPGTIIIGYDDVQVKMLDAYAEQNNLSRLDVIKLDVEGAELQVLRGGINIIDRYKPFIVMEISELNLGGFGIHAIDVYNFLIQHSYRLSPISTPRKYYSKSLFLEALKNESNFIATPF